jgi:hypothetical protein
LLLNYDFGIILPLCRRGKVFLADKIYFGGQKHTLPCSDEHQNPPTNVAGFEADHLTEK